MWWSEPSKGLLQGRRQVLVLLALAGCGFTPALGTGGPAQSFTGRIWPDVPTDQSGFGFVKQIEARLGRVEQRDFDLSYTITTLSDGVGITPEGAITRYNLTGSVVWTLTRHADGVRLAGGTVSNFTSYSATGSTVAGLAARQDAGRRLMVVLADQVVARMLAASVRFAA